MGFEWKLCSPKSHFERTRLPRKTVGDAPGAPRDFCVTTGVDDGLAVEPIFAPDPVIALLDALDDAVLASKMN